MDRRELLQSAAAITFAAVATTASSAEDHSQHHGHGGSSKYQSLISATSDCVAKGQTCLAHCLVLLGSGDKGMADCAKSVNQMLALCAALQNLAAQNSTLTPALAKITLDACNECEKNCKKHADKHAECKACMEACVECSKQCKLAA